MSKPIATPVRVEWDEGAELVSVVDRLGVHLCFVDCLIEEITDESMDRAHIIADAINQGAEDRARLSALLAHVATILDGFDKGVFVRDVAGDGKPDWALKLYPYLLAIKSLQEAIDAARKGEVKAAGHALRGGS